MTQAAVDISPWLQLLLVGLALGMLPLALWALRTRRLDARQRLRALTLITLFLTFDLVIFGAFTRLSDSGLGCPDWPGCYGSASPLGAREEIAAEVALRPSGPVTTGKAWVEMVHRYWAKAVGFLILVIAALAFLWRRRLAPGLPHPLWALGLLVWVLVQGAFGALTVTMKLFPAIVTLHLLFGLGLVAYLAWYAERLQPRPLPVAGRSLRLWQVTGLLLALQLALGGWVSTNYAVLVCADVPTCQGQWWPPMDFATAFDLARPLGGDGQGGWLRFEALTAIHVAHRLGALLLSVAVLALAASLRAPATRAWAWALVGLLLWQVVSGVSNVVLGWPLMAALMHSAGAAGWVLLMTQLGCRLRAAAVPRARGLQWAEEGA